MSEADARGVFGFVAHVSSCDNRGSCAGCTGALFKPNRVLLAAHCLCGDNAQIKVYVQTTKVNQGKSMTGRVKWVAPGYKCKGSHGYQTDQDIAVIQLDNDLRGVNPVPVECQEVRLGTQVTMIGFGGDGKGRGGILRSGTRKTSECPKGNTGLICVDGLDKRKALTFHGDSGGPLLIKKSGRYYQVGVVSGEVNSEWEENGRKMKTSKLQWATTHKFCNQIMN